MAVLEENSIIDRIEVVQSGILQIRQRNQVLKDGQEIAATFHRSTLCPGDDLTGQDPRVVAVANAVWTEEVVAAYDAHRQAMEAEAARFGQVE